jgi:hypothetical protein
MLCPVTYKFSPEMKNYLAVTQYLTTGYIIDSFDYYEEAEKLFNNLYDSHEYDSGDKAEKLKGYKSFQIHKTQLHNGAGMAIRSNGSYSVKIFSTRVHGFNINRLIFEMKSTVYAINDEQVLNEGNKFITDYYPEFIAN